MKGRYVAMTATSSVIRSPYSSLEIVIQNKPSTSPPGNWKKTLAKL
jgi:hypothetical protein